MVWNILRLLFTRGLSISRWNNFPRAVEITHLDNVGFVLHVALFLAYLEKENGEEVDMLYLMKKIIFTSFRDLVLSDINSGTKEYIRKLDPDIFGKLHKKSFDFLLDFPAEQYLKQDISEVVFDDSDRIENKLFRAAKKYVGYTEALSNSAVFPFMYEVPLSDLKGDIELRRGKIKSLDTLMKNENYQKYLSHVNRLSFSMRWNHLKRGFPVSVMSHLVIVALLSYIIGMVENENGWDYDIEKMMMKAMYHDVPEVITWDIITPTKQAVDGFVMVLEKVEQQMLDDYLFSYLPDDYVEFISSYMLHPFSDQLWTTVKHADVLSALLEARLEAAHGNSDFNEVSENLLKKAYSFESTGVDYIIKEMLLGFTKDENDISLR